MKGDDALAINRLRAADHTDIVAAVRNTSYQPFTRPVNLLHIG
ncbi:hypothetical protein [Streptomyces sp. NPDC004296]